jgi:hypothetical protein
MFHLESSIADWRQQLAREIRNARALDELESHLREDHARLVQAGMGENSAFEEAVASLGSAELLKAEFMKTNEESFYRPLAWTAWALFVAAFFLPSCGELWGWQCAWLSFTAPTWADRWQWGTIYFASLTLANLLMLASPMLLVWSARNQRALAFLRTASVLMLGLVWSYIGLLAFHKDGADLKIGCWLWTFSFLPLCLCTFRLRDSSKLMTSHV